MNPFSLNPSLCIEVYSDFDDTIGLVLYSLILYNVVNPIVGEILLVDGTTMDD